MNEVLRTKKCTNCHNYFGTFAKNPFCRNCIKQKCCMSHLPDIDGRNSCNCTFDLHRYNDYYYCLGHFKTLQDKCAVCDLKRPDACVNFQEDHMWYCEKHRIQNKKNLVKVTYTSLKNVLCIDLILEILKLSFKPATCQYPNSFNIPLRKSLKHEISV